MTAISEDSRDPATQSNYLKISTSHVHFDWTIDWKKHIIVGVATHTLKAHEKTKDVIFDTLSLVIKRVQVEGENVDAKFVSAAPHKVLGSALVVPLERPVEAGSEVEIRIEYETTEDCAAIGWLEKEQTAGRKFEYLYTQCQPIYARSIAPLQDTPSVKLTYSASVSSILPVLMSAIRQSPPSEQIHGGQTVGVEPPVVYKYKQPVPIPSYLIAIASGNLIYRAFPKIEGKEWTTGVWTEPEAMEASYFEFYRDTAKFVLEAEKMIGPYEFGVYDVLLLPPSFPYGGMENACLTFATPSLLAGDRSLVDVIAHEVSHSWSGNNVSYADMRHFWLNEGWTTYFERLLLLALHSPAERDFSYIIGRNSLSKAVAEMAKEPRYQRLVIPFRFGEDPDDGYSTIPYEKGSNFLLYLERRLGGLDVFLPYARDYVQTFRGKSIKTEDWKAHLYAYFRKYEGGAKIKVLDSVDWDTWLNGEGPDLPVEIKYDTSLADVAFDLAKRWDKSRSEPNTNKLEFTSSDLDNFGSNQKVLFLETLAEYDPLPSSHTHHLDTLYSVNTTLNSEIRSRWYSLSLRSEAAHDYVKDAAEWLTDPKRGVQGRMKFCRPGFRAINKVNPELAKKTWEANRQFFHPIARRMIDKDLGLST